MFSDNETTTITALTDPTIATSSDSMESNMYSHAGGTDQGRVRENNEDAYLCLGEAGVFCVADGMGGMQAGEIASQTTVECIKSAFENLEPAQPYEQSIHDLSEALKEANRRMRSESHSGTKGRERSGSTVVALSMNMQNPHRGVVMHAGDSRLYLLRNGQLSALTKDHSASSILEGLGKNAQKSRLAAELQGVVTRGIGIQDELEPEVQYLRIESGDVYLLCSDGLYNMVPPAKMAVMLQEALDGVPPERVCQNLLHAANEAGGTDNSTAVIVQIGQLPNRSDTDEDEPITQEYENSEANTAPTENGLRSGNWMSHYPPLQMVRSWLTNHVSRALRKRLLVGVFILLVFALFIILSHCRSNRTVTPPIQPKSTNHATTTAPQQSALSLASQREQAFVTLERAVKEARQDGDWNRAQQALDDIQQQDILLPEDRNARVYRMISEWYRFWIQMHTPDIVPISIFEDLQHLFVQVGGTPPPLPNVSHIPPDLDAQASWVSAMLYQWQVALEQQIFQRRDELLAPEKPAAQNDQHIRETFLDQIAMLLARQSFPWTQSHDFDVFWQPLVQSMQEIEALQADDTPDHEQIAEDLP